MLNVPYLEQVCVTINKINYDAVERRMETRGVTEKQSPAGEMSLEIRHQQAKQQQALQIRRRFRKTTVSTGNISRKCFLMPSHSISRHVEVT